MKYAVPIICLLFSITWDSGYGQTQKVLILDPGHGGKDSGAIAINSINEKDIVLDIAFKMLKWNRDLLGGYFDIYLTRSSDTFIGLNHRTTLARHLKPDMFISLHCNHARNEKAVGIEVYTYLNHDLTGKFNQESEALAKKITKGITTELGFANRGIKSANFQVLRDTKKVCPSVLVELGFLSNTDESNYLMLDANRNALALAILYSIK